MKFGYFDDENREYVITRPDTPLPWINYLGCQEYFGIISNTAGGYSFYRDARLRRLTRYRYNNVPWDCGGRYIYLRDEASGRVLVAIAGSRRGTTRRILLPPRHGLHHDWLDITRASRPTPGTSCRWTRTSKSGSSRSPIDATTPSAHFRLCQRRILPVGRAGRCHEFPAELQYRRSGSGRRRHLPQDGIPRAPRSFRVLRLLGAGCWLRHAARGISGPLPRLGQARGRGRRPTDQLDRARLGAHRRSSGQARS